MHDPLTTYSLLCLTAFLAGAINSIAGGGTLLTFPALLAVVDPVVANATSTVALMPGSVAGAWGYRREVHEARKHLKWLLPPSILGGILGGYLLVAFPGSVFEQLIPWLILLATVLFLLQKPMARWIGVHQQLDQPSTRTIIALIGFQFLVGLYGGYFGAGIGILMLSSLAFMGIGNIHRINAVKTVLASVINICAITLFITHGKINWPYALAMSIAAILGGYSGARIARRMNVEVIRWLVIAIGFILAVSYFIQIAGGG